MRIHRLINIFAFMAFSVMDLHIEAKVVVALPSTANVFAEPKNCLLESSLCSIKTPFKRKFELIFGESKAIMDENSAVLRQGANEISLLKGSIWVHAQGQVRVKTEYGVIEGISGEFWVEKGREKVVVSLIKGELHLVPKGSDEKIAVMEFRENWLGPVSSTGVATTGIPKLISLEEHVRRWGKLYPKNKFEFRQEVHAFFELWYSQIEVVSDHHRTLALQYQANEESEKQKRKIRLQQAQREYDRVKDMMLKRLNPETP